MKITVTAGELHDALTRVAPFAGTDKHLPELNAVRIIPRELGGLTLVTSNRYTLAERVIPEAAVENTEDGGFTVPLDAVKQWVKTIKPYPYATDVVIEYDPNVNGGYVTLAVGGEETFGGRTVPGNWVPNYGRLFPDGYSQPDGTVPHFAIGAFALQALSDAFPQKRRDGESSATFRFMFVDPDKPAVVATPSDDHWRALIMPRKTAD